FVRDAKQRFPDRASVTFGGVLEFPDYSGVAHGGGLAGLPGFITLSGDPGVLVVLRWSHCIFNANVHLWHVHFLGIRPPPPAASARHKSGENENPEATEGVLL